MFFEEKKYYDVSKNIIQPTYYNDLCRLYFFNNKIDSAIKYGELGLYNVEAALQDKSIQFLNKNEILTNWKALYTAFLGKCDMNKKDYLNAMPKLKYAIDLGKIDIESNGTHLIVGEITKIQLPEFILNKDGFVDLEAIETIASSGVDAYYSVKLLARYQYAKANQELKKIKNDE